LPLQLPVLPHSRGTLCAALSLRVFLPEKQ
jgi:hypothetical protein